MDKTMGLNTEREVARMMTDWIYLKAFHTNTMELLREISTVPYYAFEDTTEEDTLKRVKELIEQGQEIESGFYFRP